MIIYMVQKAVSTSKGREVDLQSPVSLELLILTVQENNAVPTAPFWLVLVKIAYHLRKTEGCKY